MKTREIDLERRAFASALASASLLLPGLAAAQTALSDKPVHLIVPFAPGGSTDVLARAFAQRLSVELGQPVVVENVAGASSMLGAIRVARSSLDGHTVLFASSTTLSTNPHLFKTMQYSLEDFAGVSMVASAPLLLGASLNAPFSSLKELQAYAAANPGKVSYATQGRGGISHLLAELASSAMGVTMTDVPYKGSGPGLVDLAGGQIPLMVDGIATSLPLYKSGKIRILAVAAAERSPAAPDIPTFVESGFPDVVVGFMNGLFVPKGTPAEAIRKLNAASKQVLQDPAFVRETQAGGTQLQWSTPQECHDIYRRAREQFGVIFQRLNIPKE